MKLKKEDCRKMVEAATASDAPRLSCDECHELLDAYAELMLAGKNPEEIMPLVAEHLAACPCCTEELGILLDALRAQRSVEEAAV